MKALLMTTFLLTAIFALPNAAACCSPKDPGGPDTATAAGDAPPAEDSGGSTSEVTPAEGDGGPTSEVTPADGNGGPSN